GERVDRLLGIRPRGLDDKLRPLRRPQSQQMQDAFPIHALVATNNVDSRRKLQRRSDKLLGRAGVQSMRIDDDDTSRNRGSAHDQGQAQALPLIRLMFDRGRFRSFAWSFLAGNSRNSFDCYRLLPTTARLPPVSCTV